MLAWGHGTPACRSLPAHGDPLSSGGMAGRGDTTAHTHTPPQAPWKREQKWVHLTWVPREWDQRWVRHPQAPWGTGPEVGPSPLGATGTGPEVVMPQGVPDVPGSPSKYSREPSRCGRARLSPQCAKETPRHTEEPARCAWMPARCAREPPDAIAPQTLQAGCSPRYAGAPLPMCLAPPPDVPRCPQMCQRSTHKRWRSPPMF